MYHIDFLSKGSTSPALDQSKTTRMSADTEFSLHLSRRTSKTSLMSQGAEKRPPGKCSSSIVHGGVHIFREDLLA